MMTIPFILAFLALAVASSAPPTQSESAAGAGDSDGCDRVADPNGSDSNPGTVERPFQSVQKLADALKRGQRGCLRAGVYDSPATLSGIPPLPCVIPPCGPGAGSAGGTDQGVPAHEGYFELKLRTPEIVLMSYPGERATIVGRVFVRAGAEGSVVRDLNLQGVSSGSNTTVVLNARDLTLRRNDITSGGTDTCVALTEFDGVRPNGFRILGNTIHDCGQRPPTNQEHGIYVASAKDGVIRNNVIYDNADRGIQLYPNADSTLVSSNYLYDNGQGVNIGGNDSAVSSHNRVQNNVIADSVVRWNVESSWANAVGRDNRVRGNCLRASNPDPYYNLNAGISVQEPTGFVALGNVVAAAADGSALEGDPAVVCPP